MRLLRVMSRQSNDLRSTVPRSLTSTVSASAHGAVRRKARMKAIRIMAFKPARTHGRGLQPGSGKRAFVRLHELDADPVAFFPGYLAGSIGRSPIELQLELGPDEFLVINPEACAAVGDRREAGSRS